MLAAKGDHADAVERLIRGGSSLTSSTTRGWTALHFAAQLGHRLCDPHTALVLFLWLSDDFPSAQRQATCVCQGGGQV